MTTSTKPKVTLPVYKLPAHYLDHSFWARGSKSKGGAKSDKLIHIAVGHALSNWEHVEAAASLLISHFVESNSIAAARAYGSINGARARETALRHASETFFLLRRNFFKKDQNAHAAVKIMEKCCNEFIRNYAQASGRRNDIAHGIACELSFKEQKEFSWFLVVPNYQSQKTANWIEADFTLRSKKGLRLSDTKARLDYNKIYYNNSQYVFGTTEIKVFAGKFAYLYADLLCFLHVLNPQRMTLTQAQLYELAKQMST